MSTVTFEGYWTLILTGDGNYTLGVWNAVPTTLTFDGDFLSPGDALNEPANSFYFGTVTDATGQGIVTAGSQFGGGTTVLYSNDPTLAFGRKEVVPIQKTIWTCLLAGTMILTPTGERRVQDLGPGDTVITRGGEQAEVRWVGRQSGITLFAGPTALPVLIRAGALGDGVPNADLRVSQDHAICFDGILANAHALINGTTILIDPEPPAQLDYYHVELDRHRLIVANGTFVESFVDDVTRAGFDNVDEWIALDLPPLDPETLPYPKAKSVRQLPASTRARLSGRADELTAVVLESALS